MSPSHQMVVVSCVELPALLPSLLLLVLREEVGAQQGHSAPQQEAADPGVQLLVVREQPVGGRERKFNSSS